jgi:transcriptional regulator with XRE-family HTH domain
MVLRALGEEVRRRRVQRNLSQEALALESEIHPNVVGRLERGSYNPTVRLLVKIAVTLEATLAELFVGGGGRAVSNPRGR